MSENDTAIIGSRELIKERFDHSEKQRDKWFKHAEDRFDQILESLKEIKSDLKKMDGYLRG